MTQTPATDNASLLDVPPTSEVEFILAYLREHDALCPLCGYNLRGLTMPRCPECGQRIRLAVGLADISLKPWITAVVGGSLGAGIGVLLLGLVIVNSAPPRGMTGVWASLFVSAGMIPATLILLASRKRFLRADPVVQRLIAMAGVVLAVFVVLAFLAGVS